MKKLSNMILFGGFAFSVCPVPKYAVFVVPFHSHSIQFDSISLAPTMSSHIVLFFILIFIFAIYLYYNYLLISSLISEKKIKNKNYNNNNNNSLPGPSHSIIKMIITI